MRKSRQCTRKKRIIDEEAHKNINMKLRAADVEKLVQAAVCVLMFDLLSH